MKNCLRENLKLRVRERNSKRVRVSGNETDMNEIK